MKSPPAPKLTQLEIDEARVWWNALDDPLKGNASIWILLALYAQHWAKMHTVSFDAEEVKAPRITEG